MAVTVNPNIRTTFGGEGITAYDNTDSFLVAEKLEQTRLLKASDGNIVIDYSYVNNIKTIYLQSSDIFTVTITLLDDNVIPFAINGGVFRLDPTATFMATIDTIEISTTSVTDISVEIRIYGEEV